MGCMGLGTQGKVVGKRREVASVDVFFSRGIGCIETYRGELGGGGAYCCLFIQTGQSHC